MKDNFFEQYFNKISFYQGKNGKEGNVLCPFPHFKNGVKHFETNASASFNVDKRIFHCFTCEASYNEVDFVSRIHNVNKIEAIKIVNQFRETKIPIPLNDNNPENLMFLNNLGFNKEIIEHLNIKVFYNKFENSKGVKFPIKYYDKVLNITSYTPNSNPKVFFEKGKLIKLIYPFDDWIKSEKKMTLICAGEKDMVTFKSLGSTKIEPITITGGETSIPKMYIEHLRNKDTNYVIAYDNDEVGKNGAQKLANWLLEIEVKKNVYIYTGHHSIATEEGGDLNDYFIKYKKTLKDFVNSFKNGCQQVTYSEIDFLKIDKDLIDLKASSASENYLKKLKSSIQVSVLYGNPLWCISSATVVKYDANGTEMESREWILEENNLEKVVELVDINNEQAAKNKIIGWVGFSGVCEVKKINCHTKFYKAVVADDVNYNQKNIIQQKQVSSTELLVYCKEKQLEPGKRYKIHYKSCKHTLQGQQQVLVIYKAEENNSFLENFSLTKSQKNKLKGFQGDPKTKMNENYIKAKNFLGETANMNIYYAVELTYHSCISFDFGREKAVKGTLHVNITGDSQTKKTETTELFKEVIGLGNYISLKNATEAGIIGGSDGSNSKGFQTKAGVYPKSHGEFIVLDEYAGGHSKVLKKMTTILSSGIAEIIRVNGTTHLQAVVRTVIISNQREYKPTRTSESVSKPISEYNDGIQVLQEVYGTAEDIARFDFSLVVKKGSKIISPLIEQKGGNKVDKDAYRLKTMWSWSRKKDDIVFEDGVKEKIVEDAQKLNNRFNTFIQLIGVSGWKKLAKISVSVAMSLMSTDEEFEKLLVKKEHVDWAVEFLISIYDNDTFKIKDRLKRDRIQETVQPGDVEFIKKMTQTILIEKTTNSIIRGDGDPRVANLIKEIAESEEVDVYALEILTNFERRVVSQVTAALKGGGFLIVKDKKVIPTKRLTLTLKQLENKNEKKIYRTT